MQQLPVLYDPERVEQRIGVQRRRTIWGLISTALSVAGLAALYLYGLLVTKGQPGETGQLLRWVLGFSSVTGLISLLANLLWLRALRRARWAVGQGLAMQLSHRGIETVDGMLGWDEISRVRAANGRLGQGYRLDIVGTDQRVRTFPLDGLALLPGTLDAATRAYSSGRHGVDLSVVDD